MHDTAMVNRLWAVSESEWLRLKRGANPDELVRRHGCADAAPAEEYAAFGSAIENGARHAFGEIRIVVAGNDLECAAVERLVARAANRIENRRLEHEAGVIRTDRDNHRTDATRFVTVC